MSVASLPLAWFGQPGQVGYNGRIHNGGVSSHYSGVVRRANFELALHPPDFLRYTETIKMGTKTAIGVTTCQTAMGWVGLAWSERGLVATTLPQATEAEALGHLPGGHPVVPLPAWLDLATLTAKLQRYSQGEAVVFDEPLDPSVGTPFLRRVWAATQAIARGETRTYGELARLTGSPRAARAVGQAMARNPRPIVVPCHRVVGRDGSLTGFGGGLAMKKQMLVMEGAFASDET